MAVAALALGRLDQADAELRIALQLQSDFLQARMLLAEVAHRRGNVSLLSRDSSAALSRR